MLVLAANWTAIAAVAAAVAAVGSILAAAATVYLGNETRQSVRLAHAEIQGGLRALIIEVPSITGGRLTIGVDDDGGRRCSIQFRNVGVSTAIIDHVRANSTGPWVEGTCSHHALPPAENGLAAFTLPEGAEQFLAVEIATPTFQVSSPHALD
jgi:hypothetical protein